MRKYNILFALLCFIPLLSCSSSTDTTRTIKASLTGYSEKGPFIIGTNIIVRELTEDFTQTGKSFTTQILTNQGNFELPDIEFSSNYVLLSSDGFYYNEVSGKQSNSKIELTALVDISIKNAININVLTHLEVNRVKYLIDQGFSFDEAKSTAKDEIFAIFHMTDDEGDFSEDLALSNSTKLLAISTILQGYRTEAEMTELMNTISLDLMSDGVLNSTSLGSNLINHAMFLNSENVRSNMQARYEALGLSIEILSPKPLIDNFVSNTEFEFTNSLMFFPEEDPSEYPHGKNLLHLNTTDYTLANFSLVADLRVRKDVDLKIHIRRKDSTSFAYQYWVNYDLKWTYLETISPTTEARFLASKNELNIALSTLGVGEYIIEYYVFGYDFPSITKEIRIIP